ncbi:hypothetical protein SAMN05421664_0159 [Chryseobacterium soldanellicola]|uniref:Uncharacterized protein n=1 Tax=Chryseobacterium soldanellicola TaxID=311333 RepID=A0A1H0XQC7_9FLAO|nr:hypothetical protein [Chryseobacterium soldanellicola]SDQ04981.1 hypothetical protein SAMN05421664_0159 [Chryseobacterium soldanellicola]
MNLKEGIKIFDHNIRDLKNQIKINTGIIPIDQVKTEVEYYSNAYLPDTNWRELTDSEYKKISTAKAESKIFNTLGVGEIPESLKALFKQLNLGECQSLFDVQPKFKENEKLTLKINNEINKFLNQKSPDQNYKFHRITRCMPDMHTTTFHFLNHEHIRYTGLHIDKSTYFTPHTAYKSDNRISINISQEPRHLYFVNLTLKQIYGYVQRLDSEKITSENIVEKFFALYPHYPVIKLEIKPYQYYIAPTDNFIHDGSTLGNKNFDITMVYVGMFNQY